ncbi:MAG TPA: carbohydrate kinase family protein [Actinomycetota bacterium]|nr:carbohydrate kinase family protein [Actinomycetota bacterium]
MAERFDLFVLGDANPDLILGVTAAPSFGQVETIVEDAALVLGGSGAILACGAARLGLGVALAGVIGDDLFGAFVRRSIEDEGIDTRALRVDGNRPTGLSVILARPDDRAILTSTGTIADLRGSSIDIDLVESTRHVHVSSYFMQRSLQRDLPALFDTAHASGSTTSIDPNWDPDERWDSGLIELLDRTDVFFPNTAEARLITGIDDVEGAAKALAEHATVVAVKLGTDGGFAVDADGIVRSESVPSEVVDTIGAGDSFDAGFLAGRLLGWPLERCLRLAVVCGSISTRAAGGTAAQPTLNQAMGAM